MITQYQNYKKLFKPQYQLLCATFCCYKISTHCYNVVYVTREFKMKTAPVRISIEIKERLENAMKQYRHKTGENIAISETIDRLLKEPDFKLFVEWYDTRTHED